MANATIEQLYRSQNILGVYSQLALNTTPFSQFYGLGPTTTAKRSVLDYFSLDIFNNTRRLSGFRAPKAGPATVERKPAGQFTGTLARMHEKLRLYDADIAQYRPRGAKVGTLDASGQKEVADQTRIILQRFANTREVCLASMFKGGYGLVTNGETLNVVAKGAGDLDVDSKVPSTNIGTVESIFGADSWDTTTTDIVGQFLNLAAHGERVSGLTPSVAWINSVTLQRLYNNTDIRAKVGTAVRIFDLQTGRQVDQVISGQRQSGYAVKFSVIPQILFIVYDGVHNINLEADSTASADSTKLIPDGKMIVTPMPSTEWLDQVVGGEYVRENKADNNPQWRWGFYTWQEPMTQPSGREILFVDKFIHYLKIPAAVYYVDVYSP